MHVEFHSVFTRISLNWENTHVLFDYDFRFRDDFTRRARTFRAVVCSENDVSVGCEIYMNTQSHGRVCSETWEITELHVGVVPKRSLKLQIVECWSRNRKYLENRVFFKNLRVFTQISRGPNLVFFLL